MSANAQRSNPDPPLFLTHAQLRHYGLSSADLRRGVPPGTLDWPLRGEVRLRLAELLTDAGFDEHAPISVRELRNPAGFELSDARRPGPTRT